MNLLDRTIGVFSPSWALKRAHARKVLRSYQGAEANRLTNHKKPKNQSADQELLGPFGADALRAWARALVRDNAYAWGVVDTIVSSVVGNGINCQSTLETTAGDDLGDTNEKRDKLWAEWCEVCDINGEMTFQDIQSLCQREIVEAGEVLVRFVRTKGTEYEGISRPVPLALELIEADRLALEKDTYAANTARQRGNAVVRGVEIDKRGRAVGYWIYPQHPNSPYAVGRQTPEYVNAKDIRHLFRKDRVGQSRGVTWFAPVMSWLRDLGVYVDNEIQASAVASCFGVVIKTEQPVGNLLGPSDEDTTDSNGNSLDYLEPAMIARLKPGESIETVNPGRPNSASEPWINLMLRGISVGTGLSYEIVARDYSKTNYSSSRASQLEDRRRFRRWQQLLINDLCQPVWDEFCKAAALVDADGFPTSTELLDNRRTAAPVEWQPQTWEWVDPQSEMTAATQSIKENLSTLAYETGQRGGNWRTNLYQRAKEERLRKQLNLLTDAELTAQMMAQQTGTAGPADSVETEDGPTGEWMGLSRIQWVRNRKALTDVLNGLSDGSMSIALAKAQLSMIGLSDKNIEAIVADASDGFVDNDLPAEEQANA